MATGLSAPIDMTQTDDPIVQTLKQAGPLHKEEEAVRVNEYLKNIGGQVDLRSILIQSNASSIDDIMRIVNSGKECPATEFITGCLIGEGCYRFISKNGYVTVTGPGRWRLWNPRAQWDSPMHHISEQLVQCGPAKVVRVPNGHYGLAYIANKPVVLSPDNGGLHCVFDGLFKFDRFVRIDTAHIEHGTMHIVRVPKGSYALVTEREVPAVLPYGVHVFNSNSLQLREIVNVSTESFKHQTISRFYVRKGHIGLAWMENIPVFFQEPGIYFVDSPMFTFVRAVDIAQPEIRLGSRKIITVQEGQVGVSHDHGELVILNPGRHFIEKPGHVFDEFLSTQQECLQLTKDDSMNDLMVCESRELVRIGVQATVFYNIRNPKLAVVKIGNKKSIQKFINETATAVITTIIRSTSLAEIAQGGAKERAAKLTSGTAGGTGGGDNADDKEEDFAPNLAFFDRMHSDFVERLQENFLREYGIFMLNVRIGDFKVLDNQISQTISNHALITAETQANLANLEGRRQIDLVNKDSDARIEKIQAEVDAHKLLTQTKAEAQAIRESASAKAEAKTLEADAEARSVKVIAIAEADAIKVKGEAQAESASKLGATSFGREATLARLQADMVQASLQGVTKIVYLPTEMQKNPFALFSKDALAVGAALQ